MIIDSLFDDICQNFLDRKLELIYLKSKSFGESVNKTLSE